MRRARRKFWRVESKWPEAHADFPGGERALFSHDEVDEQQRALLGLYEAFGPVEVAQRSALNETHIS